jgi:hypothetical protein
MMRAVVTATVCMLAGPGLAWASDFPTSDAEVNYGGLHASATRIDGSDEPGDTRALGFATRSFGYANRDWLTVHREGHGRLGGGTGGLEGEIAALLRGGLRVPLAPWHGPILRGGVRLRIGGNNVIYHSQLELPHAQLGYQILTERTLLEVAAHGGPTLAGHFEAVRAERPLGLRPGLGAELALHHRPFRFDVSWLRWWPRTYGPAQGPLDRIEATTCLSAWKVGLCQELRVFVGELATVSGRRFTDARAIQTSVTLGWSSSKR